MKTEGTKREWMESVNGTELRVAEVGEGDETVVFSPALLTNRQLFEPTAVALSSDHRCISYDNRGQGDSGLGAQQPSVDLMGTEGLYEDALALLDRLEIDSCHWVGVSVGGFIGVRLAARHPERIRSLVLIGMSTRGPTRAQFLPIQLFGWALRGSSLLGPLAPGLRRRFVDQSMKNMLGPTFMSDPAREADRAMWRPRWEAQLIPEAVPMLLQVFGHPGTSNALLAQVVAPTLVIVGEEEYGGDAEAREAQQGIPNAHLVTIPRAGHMVLVEQPEVGTRTIVDFIREVEVTK